MTVMNSVKAELDEYKHVVRQQMAEITKLRAEVERLTAEADAYTALRAIYTDPSASQTNKVKAAAAAIGYERPKILSAPQSLELTAEEIEPLAVTVSKQRARADQILSLPLEQRAALIPGCRNGTNGSDDTGG